MTTLNNKMANKLATINKRIKDASKTGENLNVHLNFEHIKSFQDLNQRVFFYLNNIESGYELLRNLYNKKMKEHKTNLNDEKLSQPLRAKALYKICFWDCVPQAMQQIFYDLRRAIPKPLNDWQPTFGYNWQIATKKEIFNGEPHLNLFWQLEVTRLFKKPEIKQKAEVEKNQISYQVQNAKDIKFKVLNRTHLEIEFRDGETKVHNFKDLPMFWNKTKNKPNYLADILIDLANTKDGLLRANNQFHKVFGKTNKAATHISELSKALSSLIMIYDQETTATKRWFKSLGSGSNKIWKPKFNIDQSEERELMNHLKQIAKDNKTTREIAKEYVEQEAQERDYELNGVSVVGKKELKKIRIH